MKTKIVFTQAIVRKPSKSYINGLTTSDLGKPDHELTLKQHAGYVEALERCCIKVFVLEADEDFPDSCFVEDPAIITEKVTIITNPGAPSRNGEKKVMKEVLKEHVEKFEEMQGPGTLDGGDVFRAGDHFFIGLSKRTNQAGAEELKAILAKYGYTCTFVPITRLFHLRTGSSFIGNNNVVVAGELIGNGAFEGYNQIPVKDEESYSSNCIWVGDTVIMAKGFADTKEKVEKAGYKIVEVEISEFQKQDGGLTCLSLRF